jgi:photosystem II stability/assembly factor-like uncharacterized protein
MKWFLAGAIIILPFISVSQKLPSIRVLDSVNASFRGLSVPSDSVVWVSGSNGTVGRSVDGGNTWKWITVPGFEKKDFRDIEAFDSSTAIIVAVDNPAYILKTKDGGLSWTIVFEMDRKGMFLDAMDCINDTTCVCMGDPIGYVFTVLRYWRNDFWLIERNSTTGDVIGSKKDEALFAASGTNVKQYTSRSYSFISGGSVSNLYIVNISASRKINIPILQGKLSAGAFSMHSDSKKSFYITGGDYVEYWKDSGNVVYTKNAGKTWKRSAVHGYRSCIIKINKKSFITCGTNGVDLSTDGCRTWKLIHGDGARGTDGFNVCAKSKTGKAVYFAGTGRIAKLVY